MARTQFARRPRGRGAAARRLLPTLLLAILAVGAQAQDWQLVWADEFDVPGAPDPAKWAYDIGGHGWGNAESQYYTDRPDNARVVDGALVIEAREEASGGSAYTSARLVTRGTAAWTYGRIEARIWLPEGQGIWPAFWMLPTDSPYGGWPTGGEIDIMEFLGHDPARVHGTLHYGGGDLGHRYTGAPYTLPAGRFPDGYHTFAIEWAPRQIRWYVDGVRTQTQTHWASDAAPYPAPFDTPFHLLLNVAVGGRWPGYPDATTVFPQQMRVDYVRVYEDVDAYPTVTLDAPATVEAGGTVALTATATDSGEVEEVAFLLEGAVLQADGEAPYTFERTGVADGCYDLVARATDDEGYVTTTAPATVTVGAGCPEGAAWPFGMVPAAVPSTIEAEHFDLGGPDVGYRDLGAANTGGGIRLDDGVDIAPTGDRTGGFDVVHMARREWLAYTVDVAEAGAYRIEARVLAPTAGRFRLALDGVDLFGDAQVPATGGAYATVDLGTADLPAGRHRLRLEVQGGAPALNALMLTPAGGTAARTGPERPGLGLRVGPNPAAGRAEVRFVLTRPGPVAAHIVDVTGRRVRTLGGEHRVAGAHTIGFDLSGLAPGVYAVVVSTAGGGQAQTLTVIR